MNRSAFSRWTGAVAVAVGSALLFNVQPLTGRILLPQYGGGAAVWIVCLAAFQSLLLAGYAYAVWLSRCPVRLQPLLHLILLGAALFWPGWRWIRQGPLLTAPPAVQVLLAVAAGPGPAYVALAAGTTLIQSWLSRREGGAVYRLYALSNAGALIGLLAYPLVIEPWFALSFQVASWRFLFFLYTASVGLIGWAALGTAEPASSPASRPGSPSGGTEVRLIPSWAPVGWWGLPALSAFLLTATTASLTLDVAPMPLLWVVLLGVFLVSYIFGFSRRGEATLEGWAILALFAVGFQAALRAMGVVGLVWNLLAGVSLLLFGGLFVHGWLYRLRPEPERLPLFYLGLACGGAAGGLLAALGAPLLVRDVYEYPLAGMGLALLAAVRLASGRTGKDRRRIGGIAWALLGFLLVLWAVASWRQGQGVRFRSRNFYGVVRIEESDLRDRSGGSLGRVRLLVHGRTSHGMQALAPGFREEPTLYYGPGGGGWPIIGSPKRRAGQPIRVGMVGLGVGTLAMYGRPGDLYRFYEIDPQVVALARDPRWFTFLAESEATIEIVEGDARLSLEREARVGEEGWDILIVDAFSGDAVPLHLLTREAVALCLQRLAPGGVVAFHVSNRYVDLLPLLKAQAESLGAAFWAWGNLTQRPLEAESRWAALAREPQPWWRAEEDVVAIPLSRIPAWRVVTDERGSVTPLVDWGRRTMERYVAEERARRRRAPWPSGVD